MVLGVRLRIRRPSKTHLHRRAVALRAVAAAECCIESKHEGISLANRSREVFHICTKETVPTRSGVCPGSVGGTEVSLSVPPFRLRA